MKIYEVRAGKNNRWRMDSPLSTALLEAKGMSYSMGCAVIIDERGHVLFRYKRGKCVKRPEIRIINKQIAKNETEE